MPAKTLDPYAFPLKGGRISRRAALRGAAATVATLAAGVDPALAVTPPAPVPAIAPALAARVERLVKLARECQALADHVAKLEDEVAFSADDADEAAHGERLGLPEANRRSDAAHARRDRWARQLAAAVAITPAEVCAKMGALIALLGPDRFSREEGLDRHAALVRSVERDAARFGVAA